MAIINSASEIAKKNVGSDNFSKLLEQIYSTPGSRIFEAYKRANENIKKSVGSDYLSKVLEQTYSTSGFRILETNNSANEIIKKGVGSDKLSKVLEQIYSTSRILEKNKSANEIEQNMVGSDEFARNIPLYESVMPALTYIQANRPDLFGQVNAVLSGEVTIEKAPPPAPHRHKRKVNLLKAQGLMEKSKNAAVNAYISWATLTEFRFEMILYSIDKLGDIVGEPLSTHLNYLIILLVILFVDTHTANEGPSKNE